MRSTKASWTLRLDDEARRRRAALAGLVEGAVEGGRDRDVEIGIVQHDERVLAAHFELELGAARGAGHGDLGAGLDRAGEGDGVHVTRIRASSGRRPSRGP